MSVCGTGRFSLTLEVFLGSMIRRIISSPEGSEYCRVSAPIADFPATGIPKHLNVLFRQYIVLSLLRHPVEI